MSNEAKNVQRQLELLLDQLSYILQDAERLTREEMIQIGDNLCDKMDLVSKQVERISQIQGVT